MTNEFLLPTNLQEVRSSGLERPDVIYPPIQNECDAVRLFNNAYFYFFRNFYPDEICDNLEIAASNKSKGKHRKQARSALAQYRGPLQLMRTAYLFYDEEHKAPKLLSLPTRNIGHVKDKLSATKKGQLAQTIDQVWTLANSLNQLDFAPTTIGSYLDYRAGQIGMISELNTKHKLDRDDFHDGRKAIRNMALELALSGLYQPLNHPNVQGMAYLWGLSSTLGKIHDEAVWNGDKKASVPKAVRREIDDVVSLVSVY
ncbi:hypothetical protein KC909_05330 [Candidatus Dojkabacteria bacterium]|uniref:Uncharacterized protein n=1 Tax=Candidatus Dojkabacteria bacterium TaxID=2099670 RepID=A0A955L6I1_9BACT|nr:hypothetical protein [Candidatus Dojkabacteria bacterium]